MRIQLNIESRGDVDLRSALILAERARSMVSDTFGGDQRAYFRTFPEGAVSVTYHRPLEIKEAPCGSCGAINVWTTHPPEYCGRCCAKWSTIPRS